MIYKSFNKLSYKERLSKIKSNSRYYFLKKFLSNDVKTIHKKEFKNGSWIEYNQLEVFDKYTSKIYKYIFSCKYSLGDIIEGTSRRYIYCLYVSRYKLEVINFK